MQYVAPYTGAWIEIRKCKWDFFKVLLSPPIRGRGLKLASAVPFPVAAPSPPIRGRGLKYQQ